jgi:GT2 family glycosyltransferase
LVDQPTFSLQKVTGLADDGCLPEKMLSARIVVLNYNGADLLRECLPSVVEAARAAHRTTRVTLLDNASRDDSAAWTRRTLPEVDIWRARENKVLCSYNDYLKEIREEIVILLNNDMKVGSDFVDPLIEPFEKDRQVFLVTPKCLSFDGSHYEGGRTRFRMKWGIFWASCVYNGLADKINEPGLTMAAGYGAFDRAKFLELGGYDELYLPGRLEDSDLCFRAWRQGWSCHYEPKSVIFHRGGVSFHRAFGEKGTLTINHRNSFLFIWKNLRDRLMITEHILWLPLRLAFALLRGHSEFVVGFLQAIPKLGEALRKRKQDPIVPKIRDREIFSLV